MTKWIHIHESDIGLLYFFQRLVSVLRPNGLLFFEPQPDRSYEQARRELSTELRSRARRLRLRMDDFAYILETYFGLDILDLHIDPQSNAAKGESVFENIDAFDGILTRLGSHLSRHTALSRPLYLFRKSAAHSAPLNPKAIDAILCSEAAAAANLQSQPATESKPLHHSLPFPWVSRDPKSKRKA